MKPAEILAFAQDFVTSIERGDTDAVRACYLPDAKIWHNTDGIEQTVDQNLKLVKWLHRTFSDVHYRIRRRVALDDGFLQMHVLEATRADGLPFSLEACVVVRMENGRIARLDEYIDSAQAAASAAPKTPASRS